MFVVVTLFSTGLSVNYVLPPRGSSNIAMPSCCTGMLNENRNMVPVIPMSIVIIICYVIIARYKDFFYNTVQQEPMIHH